MAVFCCVTGHEWLTTYLNHLWPLLIAYCLIEFDFVECSAFPPNIVAGVNRGQKILEADMKADTHPNYGDVTVNCSCGNAFTTRSTLEKELHIEVCSACHPFYTGKQKMMDTAGRVDKFRKRYAR